MEIVAIYRTFNEGIHRDASNPLGELIGYAVLENGHIISPIFCSYDEAKEWMEQNMKENTSPRYRGPSLGM